MAYQRVVIAGQHVADHIAAMKARDVLPSLKRGADCFDSDSLCAHQRRVSGAGYVEAQICETARGFSLRYASGLQNFGLIMTASGCGGTLEGAIAAAIRWQAASPDRRWVTRTIATSDVGEG